MKPVLKSMLAIAVLATGFLAAPDLYAQQGGLSCGSPTFCGNAFQTYYSGLLDGPQDSGFFGIVCVAGNPAINNGTASFICKEATSSCPAEAGGAGDGKVVVYGDWFS